MSEQATSIQTIKLQRTQLYDLHVASGARMVPFAGYEMPVQYAAGVLKEHLHTREAAGLFDVSHMGQVSVRAKSGIMADAALALERLLPVDILSLAVGRQRYAFFTNERGGILDDLMVANRGDHYFLVINAACKDADEAHLRDQLSKQCEITKLDRALIALQGPRAEAALARFARGCVEMHFMDVRELNILGADCVVSRSGYTGEDGFEISLPQDRVCDIADALLCDASVAPIGLGARDSLRLEAGMCLYGSDLNAGTTPVEGNIAWAIQGVRRRDGAREGGFPGDAIVLEQLENQPARLRVGLQPTGRAPVRSGALIFKAEGDNDAIGAVTSGGFGPSVDRPIAMGYVPHALASPGAEVFAEVRGKRLSMTVTRLPFIAPHYKRG